MKIKSLICIASCLLLFNASCKNNHLETEEVNILSYYAAPEQPCIESSQVIYHERLDPEELNNSQLELLSRFVCSTKPNNVWFVRVLYNYEEILTSTIYFLPDRSSKRIRKGKAVRYYSYRYTVPKKYLDIFEIDRKEAIKPDYYEYTVVLPESSSSPAEQIPAADHLLPFTVSGRISDQEVTEIVDFIRSGMKKKLLPGEKSYRIDHKLPIMSITKEGSIIIIRTGTQESGKAGSGEIIHLQKTREGYKIIKQEIWVI